MAKQPLFKSKNEAAEAIKRCTDSIKIIEGSYHWSLFDGLTGPDVIHAVGRSLMQHVYTVCEALLHLVCCERIFSRNDLAPKEWIRIHEMRKYCEKHNWIDCPPMIYETADSMAKLKKKCDRKGEVTLQEMEQFFYEAAELIGWLGQAVNRSSDTDISIDLEGLLLFIDNWLRQCGKERGKYSDDPLLYFRYNEDIDIDHMTDEEADELFRPRKGNKRESMAPLYIYLILQENTDKNHRMHVNEIREYLDEKYDVKLSRGAVERTLNTMVDGGDVKIWSGLKRGSGYWYSAEDENENE